MYKKTDRESDLNLIYDSNSQHSLANKIEKKDSRTEDENLIKRKVQSDGQYSLKGIIKQIHLMMPLSLFFPDCNL